MRRRTSPAPPTPSMAASTCERGARARREQRPYAARRIPRRRPSVRVLTYGSLSSRACRGTATDLRLAAVLRLRVASQPCAQDDTGGAPLCSGNGTASAAGARAQARRHRTCASAAASRVRKRGGIARADARASDDGDAAGERCAIEWRPALHTIVVAALPGSVEIGEVVEVADGARQRRCGTDQQRFDR